MPADVIGTNVIMENDAGHRGFTFMAGPIFSQIVLADEINRATPKTQSALLEAMQEAPGHSRWASAKAGRALLRHGHAEPAGAGGNLSASRSPA